MAVPLSDPQLAWMRRFADELMVLRPDFDPKTVLEEAERACDAMGGVFAPEEAAHLWLAESGTIPGDPSE